MNVEKQFGLRYCKSCLRLKKLTEFYANAVRCKNCLCEYQFERYHKHVKAIGPR